MREGGGVCNYKEIASLEFALRGISAKSERVGYRQRAGDVANHGEAKSAGESAQYQSPACEYFEIYARNREIYL